MHLLTHINQQQMVCDLGRDQHEGRKHKEEEHVSPAEGEKGFPLKDADVDEDEGWDRYSKGEPGPEGEGQKHLLGWFD